VSPPRTPYAAPASASRPAAGSSGPPICGGRFQPLREELERLPGLRLPLAEVDAPPSQERPRLGCKLERLGGSHFVEGSRIRELSGYSHISATMLRPKSFGASLGLSTKIGPSNVRSSSGETLRSVLGVERPLVTGRSFTTESSPFFCSRRARTTTPCVFSARYGASKKNTLADLRVQGIHLQRLNRRAVVALRHRQLRLDAVGILAQRHRSRDIVVGEVRFYVACRRQAVPQCSRAGPGPYRLKNDAAGENRRARSHR
jgi:hypothetical protein